MSSVIWSNNSDGATVNFGKGKYNPDIYRCHIAIIKDDEFSYSVVVLNLPGAGSCGDSEEEAIANVREAIAGVIEQYNDDGVPIPWLTLDKYEIPSGAKQKWILVNA